MLKTLVKLSTSGLVLGVLLVTLPATQALGQGRANLKDVDKRLKRVERVVDQSLLDLLQQVESLKREIRILRGELESQSNDLGTVKKRNRDLYLDTDQRLTDIENRLQNLVPDPDGSIPGESTGGESTTAPKPATDTEPVPETTGQAGGTSAPVFVKADAASTNSSTSGSTISTRPATAEEKTAYTKAYDMLAGGNHGETVQAFEQFLQQYPDGPYSDNAWYWQGEALYAQRKFDQAIRNFETVILTFPQSPKLPDARLKVGYSLYEQKRYDEARVALNAVKSDYPGRSAAVLAQKRLIQMDNKGL